VILSSVKNFSDSSGKPGPEEYRQVVAYHYGMARHHLFKAQTYEDDGGVRGEGALG
jgi:hypothetical protein